MNTCLCMGLLLAFQRGIPKHGVLTQPKHVFIKNPSFSLVEYLIDLGCGTLRARFDENTVGWVKNQCLGMAILCRHTFSDSQ